MSDDAAYSIVELLISGGVGTTASLVSQTLVHLDADRSQRAELIEHPERLERGDRGVPEGVLADASASSHEPFCGHRDCRMPDAGRRPRAARVEPRPTVIRSSSRRLTRCGSTAGPTGIRPSGWVHRCAGAHIARAIAAALLGQILTRMLDYVVDRERLRAYPQQGVNAGYEHIPATFTPGARLLPGVANATQP